MRKPVAAALLLAAALVCSACGKPGKEPGAPPPQAILVAAAASLRDLMTGTAAAFESGHPGTKLEFSFEASSTLARKIREGAPFDVFLSADQETVDQIRSEVDPWTITTFLSNRLALVHREGLQHPVSDARALAGVDARIALAGPAVPAGKYARAYLTKIGILGALQGRIVGGDSVRAALALVESGAADYAFVYKTDAIAAKKSRLLWTDERGDGPPIRYVAAVLNRSASSGARAYLDWLKSGRFLASARAMGFQDP